MPLRHIFCAAVLIICGTAAGGRAAEPALEKWTTSATAPAAQVFGIRGTNNRNNPLRQKLAKTYSGKELFVRFTLRYDKASIDTPAEDEGEFFVLWLDDNEGNDRSTHAGGVPNVGIHVNEGENRFMARFDSGRQSFTDTRLAGDRDYRIVARLWKRNPGPDQPFDALDLWIDPGADEENEPHASANSAKSISKVAWLGFSTGRKTEPTDRIQVSKIGLATTWSEILGLPPLPPAVPPPPPLPVQLVQSRVSFRDEVYPLLKQRCFECHAGADASSGVRLDVFDEVLNRVVPRDASASKLIDLVETDDPDTRMPPVDGGGPLSPDEIALLRMWIDDGLTWDEELLPTPRPETTHWSFQPITRPEVPQVKNAPWVRTPVDAFIARRHEQLGLSPAPPADAATLARRIALDLTGLPPQSNDGLTDPEDTNDTPFDRQIERLLDSQAYGQRWGRHWLDVARWAESNGHQHNRSRPHAWRYRDYVVQSFVDDKPYDEFIREQIAGDELPFDEEHLVATGFLAAARYSGNELDKDIQRNDILVDVVNTTAKAFLGLTVECAQCHSHKFDPISIRDYYRLQAFFAKGQPGNLVLAEGTELTGRLVEARWRIFDEVEERLIRGRRKRGYPEPILVTPSSVVRSMNASERRQFDRLDAQIAEFDQVWGWYAPLPSGNRHAVAPHEMRWPLPRDQRELARRKTYLLLRGDTGSRGPVVEPAWPAVFGPTPDVGGRPRTQLAEWLTSPDNPLTARVWVNRIWQWHFGRGLVATSGDFGTQGTSPSHPELLDWLASELIESGWSTKHIHRLILQSNTYRQSSTFSAHNDKLDPDNKSLWRWQPRRLEAEAIRDCALAVAGTIDLTAGGPSVPRKNAAVSHRRSLYLEQKRDALPHQQMLFDAPAAVRSCSRRRVSTVPLQPLYLLNSQFMQTTAERFAERVRKHASSPQDQATMAIRLALSREPRPDELERSIEFLNNGSLKDLCLVLLNLNEFVYVN